MWEASRREVLIILKRLSSLGLLETLRPTLMKDSRFAELLAQLPAKNTAPPQSLNSCEAINGLVQCVQAYAMEMSAWHEHLSGMVLGASFGSSMTAAGYQLSLSTSLAVSIDLNTDQIQWGLFGSAGIEINNSQAFTGGSVGITPFIGQGNVSGLSGSSNSLQVGPVNFSGSEDIATVGYTIGPAEGVSFKSGPGVSLTSSPANMTKQVAGGSADLTSPFVAFYNWLNELSARSWLPYDAPGPLVSPYEPDE